MSDGLGCQCGARCEADCACDDVDWTSRRERELKAELAEANRLCGEWEAENAEMQITCGEFVMLAETAVAQRDKLVEALVEIRKTLGDFQDPWTVREEKADLIAKHALTP